MSAAEERELLALMRDDAAANGDWMGAADLDAKLRELDAEDGEERPDDDPGVLRWA